MNTKTKYTLSLLGVLIIGIFLGIFINGRLVKVRINHLQNYYTEQGFRHEFIHMLNPSPKQMNEIHPILMNYAQKNRENMMKYRTRQRELMMNLQHDLIPFLTKDQLKRMNRMGNQWNHRFMRPGMHRNRGNNMTPPNDQMGPERSDMPPPKGPCPQY